MVHEYMNTRKYFINNRICIGDHWETVFLLSGDDLKIHMYREIQVSEVKKKVPRIYKDLEYNLCFMTDMHYITSFLYTQVSFQEEPSDMWFPELQGLPSSVTYMDMRVMEGQRLTALGCQNGYLKCAVVDLTPSPSKP